MELNQTTEIDHDKVLELALRVDQAVRNILEKESKQIAFYALISAIAILVDYGSMQKFLDQLAACADAKEATSKEIAQ